MSQTVFDYNSIFTYPRLPSNDYLLSDESNDNYMRERVNKVNNSLLYSLIHRIIVITFYILLIITFPISAFFCIKRIKSLERCVIFRLGTRLPIRGPGLIIKFPLIDCIQIIDLSDDEFILIDRNQQLMTSDGSIICFTSLKCVLTVMNAIKSSTQLKDAKFNAKQFVNLSFINMIGSTHLEDIELKTDIFIKQFEQNCNLYLNNWGYNCKFIDLPKFVVINRANPLNPLVSKLKGLFNTEGGIEPNSFFDNVMKLQTKSSNNDLNDKDLLSSLQSMANKYSNYVFHDLYIAIRVEEIDSIQYFIFNHKSGDVNKIVDKPNKVHIDLKAKTVEDLMLFCNNKDMNKVEITTSLL